MSVTVLSPSPFGPSSLKTKSGASLPEKERSACFWFGWWVGVLRYYNNQGDSGTRVFFVSHQERNFSIIFRCNFEKPKQQV